MRCGFCWRGCDLAEGRTGPCGDRVCRDGTVRSVRYGELVSVAVDPIEKKPLYHFLPGSLSLSVAEPGCNYRCAFCQNYEISQPSYHPATRRCEPSELVRLARRYGCASISYTYSEPSVWQDFLLDTARAAHEAGLRNVMVSNGSFGASCRASLFEAVDAFNIDLKGDEEFYRTVCGADLEPVLDNLRAITRSGRHLEVTTMVIEGIHTEAMVRELGKRLAAIGVQVWHLSRFFPRYRMQDRPATSEAFLEAMIGVARESGIPYIYAGNSTLGDATVCPGCHRTLMAGHAYGGDQGREAALHIPGGRCAFCGEAVYGVFSA